jgi:hypothetical protein
MGKEAKACEILVIIGNDVKFWQVGLGITKTSPSRKKKNISGLFHQTFEECMAWSPTYDLLKFCTKIKIARSSLCLLNS